MQDKHKPARTNGVEGEGSHSVTRDYNARAAKFIKEGKVDKAARDVERAINSPEAAQLTRAEEKGKAKRKR